MSARQNIPPDLQSSIKPIHNTPILHLAILNDNKHCLRPLAEPVRVGRPSLNFLEWNGTELLCTEGHGLLSIPEIESSSWR